MPTFETLFTIYFAVIPSDHNKGAKQIGNCVKSNYCNVCTCANHLAGLIVFLWRKRAAGSGRKRGIEKQEATIFHSIFLPLCRRYTVIDFLHSPSLLPLTPAPALTTISFHFLHLTLDWRGNGFYWDCLPECLLLIYLASAHTMNVG